MRPCVVLFARRPSLARVKTRLSPPLTLHEVLDVYHAFLSDAFRLLGEIATDAETEVWWDEPAGVAEPIASLRARQRVQRPGDLGARLLHLFETTWCEGAPATVVLGSDAPTLPVDRVRQALFALARGAPAVATPAIDGGYVLLGMSRPLPELFRQVPWGSADVLSVTRRRAQTIGIELHLLEPWHDVDDLFALQRLQREVRDPKVARRAPATAALLERMDLGRSSVV